MHPARRLPLLSTHGLSRGGGALALLLCVMHRRLSFVQALRPAFQQAAYMQPFTSASTGSSMAQRLQLHQALAMRASAAAPAAAALFPFRRLWSSPVAFGSRGGGGGSGGEEQQQAHSRRMHGGRPLAAAAAAATFVTSITGGAGGSEMKAGAAGSHEPHAGHGGPRDKPYKVVFVLGGPGAGKGTQCEKLVQQYGFVHLSAGELLRQERAKGSEDGKLIDEYLVQGKIVPVRISLGLLRREMASAKASRFLIDGFPRNFDNVQGWEELMGEVAEVEAVLAIDCPEDVLIERLLKRGETSGRTDDNVETARKRFHTYNEATRPVISYYEGKRAAAAGGSGGITVARIPGQLSREEVFGKIQAAIDPLIEREVLGLTEELLGAIAAGDWPTYERLCAADMTCFEPEARGHLVKGLEFHKFYFDNGNALGGKHSSTISQPSVRVLGRVAIVNYVRVVQTVDGKTGAVSSTSHEETRVWALQEATGQWQCVHFHRSPAPSTP